MILLVSNSRDFATDYVVARLLESGAPYIRLDLDLLRDDQVALDPVVRQLSIRTASRSTVLRQEDITSILFRAPTYLRESSAGRYTPEVLLRRHQWAAFLRSLMVFERPVWVNHPAATYRAESKALQLAVAADVGFAVPETIVTNSADALIERLGAMKKDVAVKALDSFLIRVDDNEDAFFYTQRMALTELAEEDLREMPVIAQQYLAEKIDVRVTVVGDQCFAAKILVDGVGVAGDWRLAKRRALFEPFELSKDLSTRCVGLLDRLGLVFGAIDLAVQGEEEFFLEVNPTGEWAWLVNSCGFPIDRAIVQELTHGDS